MPTDPARLRLLQGYTLVELLCCLLLLAFCEWCAQKKMEYGIDR